MSVQSELNHGSKFQFSFEVKEYSMEKEQGSELGTIGDQVNIQEELSCDNLVSQIVVNSNENQETVDNAVSPVPKDNEEMKEQVEEVTSAQRRVSNEAETEKAQVVTLSEIKKLESMNNMSPSKKQNKKTPAMRPETGRSIIPKTKEMVMNSSLSKINLS
jgi:hypothetical protein